MKGIILISFKDYFINQKKTESDWRELLHTSGIGYEKIILPNTSIPDIYVDRIIDLMCEQLMMNREELLLSLGSFFITNTAARFYKTILDKYNSLKDFIHNLNNIHSNLTSMMKVADPPTFEITEGNNKLIIKYNSKRKFIDFACGAFAGAGKYYKEKVKVKKDNNNTISITWI